MMMLINLGNALEIRTRWRVLRFQQQGRWFGVRFDEGIDSIARRFVKEGE